MNNIVNNVYKSFTIYIYSPSILLDLYINSSILSERYVVSGISISSILQDMDIYRIFMHKVNDELQSSDALNGLDNIYVLSYSDAEEVLNNAVDFLKRVKEAEEGHGYEVAWWFGSVVNGKYSELTYAKLTRALKHTVKVTRAIVKRVLMARAPGIVRRNVVNSTMIYLSYIPDVVSISFRLPSKGEAFLSIILAQTIAKYRADYPVRILASVARNIMRANPRVAKLIIDEITRDLTFGKILRGVVDVSYRDLNNGFRARGLSSRRLTASLMPVLHSYIRALLTQAINNEAEALRRLSRILGGFPEDVLRVFMDEWGRSIEHYDSSL